MRLLVCSLTVFIMSCGPVHRAIHPSPDDVRNLKRIAVMVPNDGTFIVLLDRATATAAPAVLFGLIGAAIASAHNESRDTERMTALNPSLAGFSSRATFAAAFAQAVKSGARQSDIQVFEELPDETEIKKFDAVLTFDIKNWGLRLPKQDEEQLAPFIELQTTLIRSSDKLTLWNMHDTFLGQKRTYFSDYKENGPMLRDETKETIANAGTRMATRIMYPRGNTQ
jgi:hypothetical protein